MVRVLSGRFDRLYYSDDTALVIDFKSGWSEPDPARINAQLKVLAVLVALELPTVKEVIVQIISGSHGVTEARYSLQELSHAYTEILATLELVNAPQAPLRPSPEACRFCPAILICQPYRDSTIGPLAKVQTSQLPSDPKKAMHLLDQVEMFKRLAEEIKTFYKSRLAEGFKIPNYALVQGSPRRELKDLKSVRLRLTPYLDQSELDQCSKITVTELQNVLGKKLKLRGEKAKEKFNELLDGLIVENLPEPSLKRVRSLESPLELTKCGPG